MSFGRRFNGEIERIVVYSKDRLSRIAFDLFETLFNHLEVQVEVVDRSESLHTQEQIKEAVEELVSFVHYVTSKIYGSRSYKSKKAAKCVKEALS